VFLGEFRENLSQIPGLGPSSIHLLARIGLTQIRHLLQYYPFRYEDRSRIIPLGAAGTDGNVNTEAEVVLHDYFWWGKKKTLKIHIKDDTGQAVLICFNRDFLKKQLPEGMKIRISGQFQYRFGEWQSSGFEFEPLDAPLSSFGRVLPWYPLTEGLNQKTIRKGIEWCLQHRLSALDDEMPLEILKDRGLVDLKTALRQIHNPVTLDEAAAAGQSLVFRELFHLETQITRKAIRRRITRDEPLKPDPFLVGRLIGSLSFQLTGDQHKVLDEIREDIQSGRRMNRLVQGEVGSGKTLVAFAAALLYIGAGYQAALMAPTELLCRQHARTAEKWMAPLGVEILTVTGSMTPAEKDAAVSRMSEEPGLFLIGTHALFSEGIKFFNLKLVILDEQHRFGVNQRLKLIEKGEQPDIIMMTATPIPRTLALTAWGDLDVSTIKSLPLGRKPVRTHLALMENDIKVHQFVRKELCKGRQAYFVYPLIQQSDKMDLRDAETMFRRISEELYPDYQTALIHSKLPDEEKTGIMERFNAGKISILVATTVVEVGVDVPNATIMVIEHAERFGLSALHQLRGRVGRGTEQSYVFLVYGNELTEEGKQRLKVMLEVSDGFTLAEEDLKIRGPGELAGYKQSGYMKFSIADLIRDQSVLIQAREDVRRILAEDPALLLPGHAKLGDFYRICPPFDEELLASG
jgi:ATP-dependent DNA helicase RecG